VSANQPTKEKKRKKKGKFMKKMIVVLAVLLMAVPAMAAVTITATQVGETNEVVVGYSLTGADLIRSFALDITVDNGAAITKIDKYFDKGECATGSTGYGICMGSMVFNADSSVKSYGTPYCDPSIYATGTTQPGFGTAGITVEMASLYQYVTPSIAPGITGTLLSVYVNKLPCKLTINPNATRSGIVLESGASSQDSTSPVQTNMPKILQLNAPVIGCTCYGDLTGDSMVRLDDATAIVGLLNSYGTPVNKKLTILSTDAHYSLCADTTGDGMIRLDDATTIVGWLNSYGTVISKKVTIPCPHNYGPH